MWDEMHKSRDERKTEFPSAFEEVYSEETLTAHEKHVKCVQAELDSKRFVLDLIERRVELKEMIEQFDVSTKDPKRLMGKGSHKVLAYEERFRKNELKEFPVLTRKILNAVNLWEADNTAQYGLFTFEGRPYAESIDEEMASESDKKMKKEKEKEAKKMELMQTSTYITVASPPRVVKPSTKAVCAAATMMKAVSAFLASFCDASSTTLSVSFALFGGW